MTANVLLSLSPTTTSSMSLFARLSLATPTKFHGFLSLWRNSMLTSLRAPAVARKLRSCSRVAFRSASGVCATAIDGAHVTVAATPNNKMLAGSEKRPFMAIPPFIGPGIVSAIADPPRPAANLSCCCRIVNGAACGLIVRGRPGAAVRSIIREPLLSQPHGFGDRSIDIEVAGVELEGVGGWLQGSEFAGGIAFVAGPDVGEDVVVMGVHSALFELVEAAPGADLGRGGDEQLHVGLRRDHGPDVAAVEHGAPLLPREILLALEQGRPHRRVDRDGRGELGYRLAPELGIVRVEAEIGAGAQRLELVRRIAAPAPQVERDRAVEQPGVHERQAEMRRERAGNRPLPARRRSVDGDDRHQARSCSRSQGRKMPSASSGRSLKMLCPAPGTTAKSAPGTRAANPPSVVGRASSYWPSMNRVRGPSSFASSGSPSSSLS